METDQELLARYVHCKMELDKANQDLAIMKVGPARDRKTRWCGSLLFTLLDIKQQMEERNLVAPC